MASGSLSPPVTSAAVFAQAEDPKRIEDEQRFLADVGAVLNPTLDYEDTLTNIAQLAVRDLADLCIIDVVQEGGKAVRLKVMSRDSSLASLCRLFMRVPLEGNRPYWFRMVVENKRPVLMEHLSPAMIESFSRDESDRQAIRAAGFHSAPRRSPSEGWEACCGVHSNVLLSISHLQTHGS